MTSRGEGGENPLVVTLTDQLRSLWADGGIHEKPMDDCPELLDRLETDDPEIAKMRLIQLAERLQSEQTQAIRAAWGFGAYSGFKNPTRRREAVRKQANVSLRAMRFREDKAVESLVELLQRGGHNWDDEGYRARMKLVLIDRLVAAIQYKAGLVSANPALASAEGLLEQDGVPEDEESHDLNAPSSRVLALPRHWARPVVLTLGVETVGEVPLLVGVDSSNDAAAGRVDEIVRQRMHRRDRRRMYTTVDPERYESDPIYRGNVESDPSWFDFDLPIGKRYHTVWWRWNI